MNAITLVGHGTTMRRKIPEFSNLSLFDEKVHGSGFNNNNGHAASGLKDCDESLFVGSRGH